MSEHVERVLLCAIAWTICRGIAMLRPQVETANHLASIFCNILQLNMGGDQYKLVLV